MTRDEVTSQVQRQLDDLSASFFSAADDINPSIQDGYNLIVSLCETLESSATVSFVNNLVFYNLQTYISDYLRVFGIFNNNTRRWLWPMSQLDMLRIRNDWELMVGEPRYFVPIDHRTMAIAPTQGTASGNMTILYKGRANTLSGNSTPAIPQEWHKVLRDYAVDDLLDQCQEWTKAMMFFERWNFGIDEIRKVLRNRSLPNQIYIKRDFRGAIGF